MIEFIGKHQASLFADTSIFRPNTKTISSAMTLFEDYEMLPSNYQELAEGELANRFKLDTQDNKWSIQFNHGRIDVFQNHQIESSEAFVDTAGLFLRRITDSYDLRGNRISLITAELSQSFSEEALDKVFTKFFRPIDYYSERLPFEWDQRLAVKASAKICSIDEMLNVILEFRRANVFVGDSSANGTHRLEVKFDINTQKESQGIRIGGDFVKEFYAVALKEKKVVWDQLKEAVNV